MAWCTYCKVSRKYINNYTAQRLFVTATDISRPCQPEKLIPLLPWPGFDPSFSGHNDQRTITSEWTWLRLKPLSHRGWHTWHGAHTCKVSRKYINVFSSYSAKTKRDGQTDRRADRQGHFNISRAFGAAGDKNPCLTWPWEQGKLRSR